MPIFIPTPLTSSFVLPSPSALLSELGLKFTGGGTHISRTIMLTELETLLTSVPQGSPFSEYREAILQRNVLGKTTDSTRQKTLRHLRELYALDEEVPIFKQMRTLHALDPASLPLLAMQVDCHNLLDAVPQRFSRALEEASTLLEPEAVRIDLPAATIHSMADLDEVFTGVRDQVDEQLKSGPVIL